MAAITERKYCCRVFVAVHHTKGRKENIKKKENHKEDKKRKKWQYIIHKNRTINRNNDKTQIIGDNLKKMIMIGKDSDNKDKRGYKNSCL